VETTLTITTSATRVGEWLPDASGNWSTAANWTLLPNAISDVAKLTRNITANRTVTLDQAVTLGGLETGDTDGTHAYLLAPGTGGSLAWSNNGGGASITQLSTSKGDTISTPSRLLDNLAITNNSANALTISGAVAVEKTNATLTQTGGGSVQLSGGLTFTPASGASFTFSGTTGALTSLGPLGLAADMGAFSLSGSPLALAGSVTVGANTTATLSNAIPAGAITKLGGGSLSLSGLSATPASNHPGLTTIDQGTLRLSQDSAFTGGLTFGASDGSANPGSLDLANASASFAGAMSVRSINATANTITIGTGQKLTNTGDVTWGYNVASGTPTLKLTVGGGGEWAVTASNKTFGGASGGTRNYQSEIDLSTLATFTANLRTGGSGNAGGTFRVGTNSSGAVGTYNFVKLAANSTVSADTLDCSSPSGGPGLVSLLLGSGTQVINSDTINLSRGTRDSSALKFNTTTGTIKIRGTAGGDTDRANVNMVTGTTTGGTVTSTLDLTGHTTDLFLGAVKVYAHAVATTSSLTNSYSAVFSFDQGVLDATSFQIGSKSAGSFQNPGFATVNIGGASNLTNNATLGAVTMGLVSTTDPTVSATNASLTSKLNINGSATTANFATLSMANYTGTANATINSEVNILGGTTTATGGLTMAEGNKGVVNSTLTISGGSLSLGTSGVNATNGLYRTITGATATTTLTLNGGSLNLNGNAIGGAGQLITTNFQSGTLSNVSEINNGAGLTKTGNGTLNLAGTNTYAGDTSVSAGSLVISVGGSLRLRPAAATVSNKIALSGTGSLTFDGELYLDLVAADTTVGSQWPLVQTSAAAPAYGTSFSVNSSLGAFTKVGSAWTRLAAGKVWTFTPATGVLSIATAATPLQTWAAAKGLTPGVNDAPTANPDGDTFNNLGEFAFDGDPLSATDPNKLVGMVATVGGQSVLTYTLPVRTGATFSGATEQVSLVIDGILYRVRGSTDLAAWDLVVTEVTGPDALAIQSGLPALSPGWTYRTFLAPGTTSTTPRAFLRSVVELP
jgi:autotransporter-associated beta strand protein